MDTSLCPCGSSKIFDDCCQPFMTGDSTARTPEQLMRSRYSAYSQANIDYIVKTMCGAALQGFDAVEAKNWAEQANWLGLNVISTSTTKDKAIGFVTFFALYELGDGRHYIYEKSEFHSIENKWYYVTGSALKLRRNELCLCASGKKAKRCCAQA